MQRLVIEVPKFRYERDMRDARDLHMDFAAVCKQSCLNEMCELTI